VIVRNKNKAFFLSLLYNELEGFIHGVN